MTLIVNPKYLPSRTISDGLLLHQHRSGKVGRKDARSQNTNLVRIGAEVKFTRKRDILTGQVKWLGARPKGE